MLIHNVYFWLRPDLTEAESEQFAKGVASIASLPTVRNVWYGKPAGTAREVIDSSYSYGLVVTFDDMAGHDDYQVHPDHLTFVAECRPLWTRVQVYDFQA